MEKYKVNDNQADVRRDETEKPLTEDVTAFECCNEVLVFAMQDRYHQFSMGLGTVLECLQAAEREGAVPPLPRKWWIQVKCMYQ